MPILKENRIEDFRAVTMPHLNALLRAARRLTKNRRAAEILIEDIYLQAWRAFRFYKPETDSRAWLFLILFNKFNCARQKSINGEFHEKGGGERAKPSNLAKAVIGEEAFL